MADDDQEKCHALLKAKYSTKHSTGKAFGKKLVEKTLL